MKILLIEDDIETTNYIVKGLQETGYVVDSAYNGEDGLYLAKNRCYDVLIIDRMLPQKNGLSVVKELRIAGNTTPIIILSALGDVNEKVEGLRIGADDYLSKPYAFSELLARVNALIRRKQSLNAVDKLQIDNLVLDLKKRIVTRNGRRVELQPQEFKILEYLMRHSGQVITRTMLLEAVWNYNFDPQTNVVDVHISRLRSKIDKGFDKQLIQTIRNMGYKIE